MVFKVPFLRPFMVLKVSFLDHLWYSTFHFYTIYVFKVPILRPFMVFKVQFLRTFTVFQVPFSACHLISLILYFHKKTVKQITINIKMIYILKLYFHPYETYYVTRSRLFCQERFLQNIHVWYQRVIDQSKADIFIKPGIINIMH